MEKRIALISIIIEKAESIEQVNATLHNYAEYVIGRMGIPYREKNVNIISIAVDAPTDAINALAGAIGRIDGVGVSTLYSKMPAD